MLLNILECTGGPLPHTTKNVLAQNVDSVKAESGSVWSLGLG